MKILVQLARTGTAKVVVDVDIEDPGGEVPAGYNHLHPEERRARWLTHLHHDRACQLVGQLLDTGTLAGDLIWQFGDIEINDTDLAAPVDEEAAIIIPAADTA